MPPRYASRGVQASNSTRMASQVRLLQPSSLNFLCQSTTTNSSRNECVCGIDLNGFRKTWCCHLASNMYIYYSVPNRFYKNWSIIRIFLITLCTVCLKTRHLIVFILHFFWSLKISSERNNYFYVLLKFS